jgi:hypothetical protein
MAVGDTLHRIARNVGSADLCSRVLDPSIADLQHDYARASRPAERLRTLVGGYAAFWRSLAWCVGRDAVSRESRDGLAAAAAALVVVACTLGACEVLFLHTTPGLRMATFRVLYWGPFLPYVGWSARIDTGTLVFGLPLAMLPALLHATRRSVAFTPGAALLAIALCTLLTIASSGWIAPAVVRANTVRQYNRFIADSGGHNKIAIASVDLHGCPDCSAWPDLIRGAFAPLKHRYPGYPNYVAPEDRGLPEWYQMVLRQRLLLIILSIATGLIGWRLGLALERRQADDDGILRTRDDGGRCVVVVGEDGED